MESLKNKRVLVTGGSSGIGEAIVRKFAEQGAKIGIHYSINDKNAKLLEKELSKKTIVKIYKENFLKDKLTLMKKFIKDFGGIDILINNAGMIAEKSYLEMEQKDYDLIFNVNSRAPFLLSKEAFLNMTKNKFGRIINISSTTVKFGKGRNNTIQYAATKATLEVLTTGLAKMGAKYNILVNSIRPGFILTRLQKNRLDFDSRVDLIPVKRAGLPEDVANMVIYLASDKGSFITGECIDVSGGE